MGLFYLSVSCTGPSRVHWDKEMGLFYLSVNCTGPSRVHWDIEMELFYLSVSCTGQIKYKTCSLLAHSTGVNSSFVYGEWHSSYTHMYDDVQELLLRNN